MPIQRSPLSALVGDKNRLSNKRGEILLLKSFELLSHFTSWTKTLHFAYIFFKQTNDLNHNIMCTREIKILVRTNLDYYENECFILIFILIFDK